MKVGRWHWGVGAPRGWWTTAARLLAFVLALTLAAPEDWSALAQDAAVGRPLPNCLVGVAAMHLFDRDFRAPGCVNHHLLYSPRAVSDAVRHHVCALERDRRRAVAAIAGSMTNEEWV